MLRRDEDLRSSVPAPLSIRLLALSAAVATRAHAPRPSIATVSPHVAFLDGIRGLAALFVVLHHAYAEVDIRLDGSGVPGVLRPWTMWLQWGHYAVAVFIVVSGYCLMLPVVRDSGTLRGGLHRFVARRARRILPPYYAALALSIAAVGLIAPLSQPAGVRWDSALPVFTSGVLLSHALLVHNARPEEWLFKINPPFWSIAVEWQIYFVFALALLPIYRRWGIGAAVGLALLAGEAPHFVLRHAFDPTAPWYVGLFAFGMAAAVATGRATSCPQTQATSLPAGALSAVTGLTAVTLLVISRSWSSSHAYVVDVLVGGAAACFIAACSVRRTSALGGAVHGARRLLETRLLTGLGAFSYSLYLVHFPLLALLHVPLRAMHLPAVSRLALLLVLGVPVCLALAWIFHLAFERPFMRTGAAEPAHPAPAPIV